MRLGVSQKKRYLWLWNSKTKLWQTYMNLNYYTWIPMMSLLLKTFFELLIWNYLQLLLMCQPKTLSHDFMSQFWLRILLLGWVTHLNIWVWTWMTPDSSRDQCGSKAQDLAPWSTLPTMWLGWAHSCGSCSLQLTSKRRTHLDLGFYLPDPSPDKADSVLSVGHWWVYINN